MASGANDDVLAGPPTTPSLTGPTHTSEPIPRTAAGRPPTDDGHPPPLPTQLRDPQRYHFLGEHGRGGLGRVSRAHDRELGRDVAIKELLARGNANEMRFLREVLITARLEHPGIVPVHEAGRWADGTPFYAMKLVAGRPLRDLIAERATVEQRIGLLHHVIAVADAIAYAHGRNIIHRDLKPSNVIVGDFGETIVIDWGLAKDLSTAEVSAAGDGPFRANPDDELTSTGSVLGTRSYMAPEQERGEPVDQRADVYAIGIMLWELCSLHRIPPSSAHTRHHMLRRAGIDEDLVTILDKALAPDPELRYPEAGALAADLKAFKSGARIAARSYSLFAMLAHWTRRHRALALSATLAIALTITGSVLYVRNITMERDRADTSQALARTSLDELTLKHAELLLTSDPSAAIDALATYHGADAGRAGQIRAEADGRGVAFVRAVPHTDNIRWTQGGPAGAILSLSIDGTIARTSLDGSSVVLARNVSRSGVSAYSPARHLLAYACNPSDLCLFDARSAAPLPVASALRDASATSVAFSADGNLLAIMSRVAGLKILDITDPARPTPKFARALPGAVNVTFLAADIVATGNPAGVAFVGLDRAPEPFALPGIVHWTASWAEHELALGTATGEVVVLDAFPVRAVARAELCRGPLSGLSFIPGRRDLAYACKDGTIGIWDSRSGVVKPRAQLEGHADIVIASPAGDYLIAAGGNGTIAVLDLVTDLIATYQGHGSRLTFLTPPSLEHPFVISGDAGGAIRAWPLPPRLARVATTATSPFHTVIFAPQLAAVIATTWLPALTVFAPASGARTLEPHIADNVYLEGPRDSGTFVTYGLRDDVEVWSTSSATATATRIGVIPTGHGSVSQLQFIEGTDDFLTSGRDGRLVRWTPAGHPDPIATFDQPIDKFARDPATGSIVVSTANGALWRTTAGGQARSLRSEGPRVNRLVDLPAQRTIYAGDARGDVVAIDTTSWQQETILHGSGAVAEIATTRDGRTLAVSTHDGAIQLGTRSGDAAHPGGITWRRLAVRAHQITLTSDGLLIASGSDGTIRLYSPARGRWLCVPTGTADLGRSAVTADGKAAVVLDFEGRMLWVDLEAARKQLEGAS